MRTSRIRGAPRERRTAISRRRVAARESRRVARVAGEARAPEPFTDEDYRGLSGGGAVAGIEETAEDGPVEAFDEEEIAGDRDRVGAAGFLVAHERVEL